LQKRIKVRDRNSSYSYETEKFNNKENDEEVKKLTFAVTNSVIMMMMDDVASILKGFMSF